MDKNIDLETVKAFGEEWNRFDQADLTGQELQEIFDSYFSIFPWNKLPENSVGLDIGCGSGRWAKLVASKVFQLHCIDASATALDIAKKNLEHNDNCQFHLASVESIPLRDESADFAYSIGVLHHIPDVTAGIRACVLKLKREAPFLVYLYYAFDNKSKFYSLIWKVSEVGRFMISRLPFSLRYVISQLIALFVYLPLAKIALFMEFLGFDVGLLPLSCYRKRSFYVMRTDALDRFGTRLEKRFTRKEILNMMEGAGLKNITFNNSPPYWCAVGYKK
jgi:ubiquinone/menaquinone biosynthesis C-methylase UbiE